MKLEKIERKLNALYMDLKYAQLFTSEDSVTDEVNTVMENIKGILTEPKEKLMVSALKEIAQQLDLVLKRSFLWSECSKLIRSKKIVYRKLLQT